MVLGDDLESVEEVLVLKLSASDVVRGDAVQEHEELAVQPFAWSFEVNSVFEGVVLASEVVVQAFIEEWEV